MNDEAVIIASADDDFISHVFFFSTTLRLEIESNTISKMTAFVNVKRFKINAIEIEIRMNFALCRVTTFYAA